MSDIDSIIASLSGVGSSKDVLSGKPESALGQLLLSMSQDVIDELRASIEKHDLDASGNLKAGIKATNVTVDGDAVTVGIAADFYWKFLNYGVNGTLINRGAPNWGTQPSSKPFGQAMKDWERHRGITYNSAGESSWKSLSHVEGMSMAERGQKPRPFFTEVVNDELKDVLRIPIEKLLKRSITLTITEPFKNGNNNNK